MKKFILTALATTAIIASLCSCGNKQLFDTTYTFDKAIISLPNGEVVEGKVDSWTDYEDGDQIQVKVDGTIYLVHSSNIVLIQDTLQDIRER